MGNVKKSNFSADFSDAKNDLIAELKLSHTMGGVSKLRLEQAKQQEEEEHRKFKRFLSTFTAENYLDRVPEIDAETGEEIPQERRERLAKKAADKDKRDAIRYVEEFDESDSSRKAILVNLVPGGTRSRWR